MATRPASQEPVPAGVMRKYRFYAVALSALVYPGMGQFLQRRWAAAVFFVVTFTPAVVIFTWDACRILWNYYRMAFAEAWMEESAPPAPVPAARLLVTLVICSVIYLWNILDAALGARKKPPAAM